MKYAIGFVFLILVSGFSVGKIISLKNSYEDISQSDASRFKDISEGIRNGVVEYSNDQIAYLLILNSQNSLSEKFVGFLFPLCVSLSFVSVIGIPVAYWVGLRAGLKNKK